MPERLCDKLNPYAEAIQTISLTFFGTDVALTSQHRETHHFIGPEDFQS